MADLTRLTNVELAFHLRKLQRHVMGGLPDEAARRLEAIAMANDECQVLMIERSSVQLEKMAPVSLKYSSETPAPCKHETMVVGGLVPGEHRAVDRFGEIIIVQRAARRI